MHRHAAELFESMRDNPRHVATIIHLILLGDYGAEAKSAAQKALGLSRKAKLTRLTQLAGRYEFGVSSRGEVKDWNRLTKVQQAKLDRAILAELRHHANPRLGKRLRPAMAHHLFGTKPRRR